MNTKPRTRATLTDAFGDCRRAERQPSSFKTKRQMLAEHGIAYDKNSW